MEAQENNHSPRLVEERIKGQSRPMMRAADRRATHTPAGLSQP
jgi:hypothetical protein